MKIERLSENQIRCTLNKADLAEKEIMLTELAYGTDKAKELFRELMEQASIELGFEVDNIPLMIEAIPVNPDCLILIITKVEDPDELDTRFSRFTKHLEAARAYTEDQEDDEDQEDEDEDEQELPFSGKAPAGAEGLFEALNNLTEGLSALSAKRTGKVIGKPVEASGDETKKSFRLYGFKNLDTVILSANSVKGIYDSTNTLYKNPKDNRFYLYLTKDNNTDTEFIRTCNILGEYGNKLSMNYAGPSYLNEHYKVIIKANALQTLSEL
ncbi:MAG: adaptor protein MecA [Lachnospiraceae bacterium]|nr:adaptor protein MecA [Lachnospiraceae bacterium]MBQ8165541.1 adaptor protein MecA [Lachnospiraceae bacterium]